jgi:hypothetical protein
MHYANGREAKNGDRILRVTNLGEYNKPIVGILHDAVAGNDTCNGNMAEPADMRGVNLLECLHIDDVIAAIGDRKAVEDTSKVCSPMVSPL